MSIMKDEEILEYLQHIYPTAVPNSAIHWNLITYYGADWAARTSRRRVKHLIDKGFVEKIERDGDPYYRISDVGLGYLRGEIDAKDY
jgi:predicted transcriptional regulator with HTH domain